MIKFNLDSNKNNKHLNQLKDLFLVKDKKIINLMNTFWIISIFLNILSISSLFIFYKYYISINLFFLGKELAVTSLITLCFSFICSLMFENYFLKQ